LLTYVNLFACEDKEQKLVLMTQFTASLDFWTMRTLDCSFRRELYVFLSEMKEVSVSCYHCGGDITFY
jgi:hypothetical protein